MDGGIIVGNIKSCRPIWASKMVKDKFTRKKRQTMPLKVDQPFGSRHKKIIIYIVIRMVHILLLEKSREKMV